MLQELLCFCPNVSLRESIHNIPEEVMRILHCHAHHEFKFTPAQVIGLVPPRCEVRTEWDPVKETIQRVIQL